ncbi:hypothetical protein RRF57_000349 [Xylaria bambusicola]|uniref:Uncharacterized protein n=1 Tax=Xylaria bambusicola TaxID=326684 RepID=A0AAN7UAJ3_9PEZI
MYSSTALVALTVLADVSLAQTYLNPVECTKSIDILNEIAPTLPAKLEDAYGAYHAMEPNAEILLKDPAKYVRDTCSFVLKLDAAVLPDFQEYGHSLLQFASTEISSYDAIITKCITTGAAAASITSYLHSIVSAPDALCKPTSTPAANGTASITPYPTPTNGTGGGIPGTSVPVAAAARPTGALLGAAAAMGGLLGAVAML